VVFVGSVEMMIAPSKLPLGLHQSELSRFKK